MSLHNITNDIYYKTTQIIMSTSKHRWGFLRETNQMALDAGVDRDTGLHRTGLEDYLAVIFPEIDSHEWIHDKVIDGIGCRIRPDYRCERLKLIIEFDGVQHYQKPDRIKADIENQKLYENNGYKVVRIPYFIQLSNSVVKIMFGRDVKETLFDDSVPSLGVKGRNTPAYCCPAGLKRMAKEFRNYPIQYAVNIKALEDANDEYLTGVSMLKEEYDKI